MVAAPLVVAYRYAHGALERNLEDISEAEALVSPERGGNCVNWLVGHVLWSRNRVHALLGIAPAWPEQFGSSECYHRGAAGFPADDAVPLHQLREGLRQSQASVIGGLERASTERLSEPATETMTVGEQLAFLGFHEGYHVGQVGLLRRFLGKTGAIK